MLPIWVYGLVALAMAALAFTLSQLLPGAGMIFLAGATPAWAIYASARARRSASRP